MMRHIDRDGVQSLLQGDAQLIDVLSAQEYAIEHIPGALSVPLGSLGPETARRLDPDCAVIVYCHDYQ